MDNEVIEIIPTQTCHDDNNAAKIALALQVQAQKAIQSDIVENNDLGIGNIGLAIHNLREILGLTLEEVSEKSNMTVSYLSLIENGKRLPKFEALGKIAKALGDVPIYYLMLKAEILNGIKDDSKAQLVKSFEFVFDTWITNYLGPKKKKKKYSQEKILVSATIKKSSKT